MNMNIEVDLLNYIGDYEYAKEEVERDRNYSYLSDCLYALNMMDELLSNDIRYEHRGLDVEKYRKKEAELRKDFEEMRSRLNM